jgi:hypothetical protein
MMHRLYVFLLFFIQPLSSFCQLKTHADSVKHTLSDPLLVSHDWIYAAPETNLDRDFTLPFQQPLNNKDCKVYTTTDIGHTLYNDTLSYHDYIFKNKSDMFLGKSFRGNIYPLFGGDYGSGGEYGTGGVNSSGNVHDYFGGLHTDGIIGKKFSYSANVISGELNGPAYLDSIIKYDRVVPGMGYAYGNAKTGYSYQYWDANLSYTLNDIFNFQVGKGKQFWGDGYRSLILSDASNSYPYFKITANVWHIQYTNLYTIMQDVEPTSIRTKNFPIKYGAFHFLTWNASRRFNFSLFEAVIWSGNQGNSVRSFDPNYLNPVIFYRPIEFSLGSSDNELVGGTFKIKASKNGQFYGQVLIDDFEIKNTLKHNGYWTNKQGLQFGFKEFNLFNGKNVTFQTEINYVRPYTYSHSNVQENYSNYGQPLGDPMGANFIESNSFLSWYTHNLIIEGSLTIYHVGFDPTNGTPGQTDYGQNIFIDYDYHVNDYGNYVGQGVSTYFGIVGLRVAYIISSKMHLKAEMGADERFEKSGPNNLSSPYVHIGLKTSLGNLYNDF